MYPQSPSSTIAVSFADMLPLLLDAAGKDRAWLEDFEEDVLEVPRDLYEVLVAYRCMLKQDAAA